MSQAKVDRYKENKANRKQIIKKQKTMRVIRKCVVTVLFCGLVGWVGYSAFDSWQANRPRRMTEVNFDAIDEYLQELTAEGE